MLYLLVVDPVVLVMLVVEVLVDIEQALHQLVVL
tara:strand:- start:413 stop:514 length:102 start_codon:yes stop_codon:yes gene_type:complete